MTAGKPFPKSLEAERALLGGLMQDPRRIVDVKALCPPEDMYQPAHEALYRLMIERDARGLPVDMVALPEEVMRLGADKFGGVSYVVQLADHAISANAEHYARGIHADALRRRLIETADRLRERAFTATEDVDRLLTDAAEQVMSLGEQATDDNWRSMDELVESNREMKRLAQASGGLAIATCFDQADALMKGGLHRGRVYVVAARPAVGKTALGLQLAVAATWQERSVGVFSMEMDGEESAERLLQSHAEANVRALNVFVDDEIGLDINQIMARATKLKRKRASTDAPLGVLVLDYLQLVECHGNNRAEAVGEVSRLVKGMARKLKVAIVLMVQLNRECEKRLDKRPVLSDLAESGKIEQDADVVLMMYKDSDYNLPPGGRAAWDPVDVIVTKNRTGPKGVIRLLFNGEYQRMVEVGAHSGSPHGSMLDFDYSDVL